MKEIGGKYEKWGATVFLLIRKDDKPSEDHRKKLGFLIRSNVGQIDNQKSNALKFTQSKLFYQNSSSLFICCALYII